jgi:glycosyltransferase involved in cell wall biosynthesis
VVSDEGSEGLRLDCAPTPPLLGTSSRNRSGNKDSGSNSMRIAYVAPYHGPTVLRRRPIVRNRSMSGALKIELIAGLLRARCHDVEVISQGEVVDPALAFYPSLLEGEPFHPKVSVRYASALPIRRLNGAWSNRLTLQLFKARHSAAPFDLVIIYNLKGPQVVCANYAIRRLGLPVVLEYEDDRFVDVSGRAITGLVSQYQTRACAKLLDAVAGCMAVSPHLLSQLRNPIPKLLLRGVVGQDIIEPASIEKQNIVLFSGTHIASNGVAELIEGWRRSGLANWELHITGYGGLTEKLRDMAAAVRGVIFHGLVSRPELIRLMRTARICMNPHQVSATPGNVFAFKIIEYLAAGAHVITTPMGDLEKELEAGITYMPENSPATIAETLQRVVQSAAYRRVAKEAAQNVYGPAAVSRSLDTLLQKVGKAPAVASA